MPQLHVLPAVPSFGSKLADTLTGAIGNLGQGYMQGKAKQNDQTILQSIASNPNATAMDYISAFSQLSPESRQQLSPLVNTLLQTQSQQKIAANKPSPGEAERQKQEVRSEYENKQKAVDEQKDQEEWQNIFQRLDEEIELGSKSRPFTTDILRDIPWTEAAKHPEALDVLGFQLEKYARDRHTKGALSKGVFEALLKKVPSSEKTIPQNKASVEEWKKIILKNDKDQMKEANSEGNVLMKDPKTGKTYPVPREQVAEGEEKYGWVRAK